MIALDKYQLVVQEAQDLKLRYDEAHTNVVKLQGQMQGRNNTLYFK